MTSWSIGQNDSPSSVHSGRLIDGHSHGHGHGHGGAPVMCEFPWQQPALPGEWRWLCEGGKQEKGRLPSSSAPASHLYSAHLVKVTSTHTHTIKRIHAQ